MMFSLLVLGVLFVYLIEASLIDCYSEIEYVRVRTRSSGTYTAAQGANILRSIRMIRDEGTICKY
jgi:hypothetical protein